MYVIDSVFGAGSRNRTGTLFPARDFESRASTYSAIPATRLALWPICPVPATLSLNCLPQVSVGGGSAYYLAYLKLRRPVSARTMKNKKIREILLGKALDPMKSETRHSMALVAFLAWVGLGADGFVLLRLRPGRNVPCAGRVRRLLLSLTGFVICSGILAVLLYERFTQGGWAAVAIIAAIAGLCVFIRQHYRETKQAIHSVDEGP